MRWLLLAAVWLLPPTLVSAQLSPSKNKNLEGEVSTTIHGKVLVSGGYRSAEIHGMSVSVRVRIGAMLDEPVELYLMKYDFDPRASLSMVSGREGESVHYFIRSDPDVQAGGVREVHVDTWTKHYTVAPDVFRLLKMGDPWFVLDTRGAVENWGIVRKYPGALSQAGRWSFDSPGSPNWNRLFQRINWFALSQDRPVDEKEFDQDEKHFKPEGAKATLKHILQHGWAVDLKVYAVEVQPDDLLRAIGRGGIKPPPVNQKLESAIDKALERMDKPSIWDGYRGDIILLRQSLITIPPPTGQIGGVKSQ